MKIIRAGLLLILIFFLKGNPVSGQTSQPAFDVQVTYIPEPILINGQPTLYYELSLTNASRDSLALESLKITDTADLSVLAAFNTEVLRTRCGNPGMPTAKQILPPQAQAVLYLEYPINKTRRHSHLNHHFRYSIFHNGKEQAMDHDGPVMQPAPGPPLVLGAPLSSGPWAAVYDPSWATGHRRVIFTTDGKAHIPGRFAIDFVKLDEQGQYAAGNEEELKNWYGYGSRVLAVADGIIAATCEDFKESTTLSGAPAYSADKATGNYISIDLGNGHFAFYEHLKPGSIKVKPRQAVKKGELIASLGFTGQSTGPHLHFHMADANSPLGAEGIPFVFENFSVLGVYNNLDQFGKKPWIPAADAPETLKEEHPAPNTVLKF